MFVYYIDTFDLFLSFFCFRFPVVGGGTVGFRANGGSARFTGSFGVFLKCFRCDMHNYTSRFALCLLIFYPAWHIPLLATF